MTTVTKTSLDANVNLFFNAGALRNDKDSSIVTMFLNAFKEDSDVALRLMQYIRDIRGGMGERKVFRDILVNLSSIVDEETFIKVLNKVPEIGRWDDLLVLSPTDRMKAYSIIKDTLLGSDENKAGLCAKWMPRPKKSYIANELCSFMKLTPKEYRKLLVRLTNVVETKMCAKQWDTIVFEHVPSVASSRYQKAFERNAPHYQKFIEQLEQGTTTVNAGTLFPHDVIRSIRSGNETVSQAQWDSLPDYVDGNEATILPMVDVSGSMMCPVSGANSVTCMDAAIGLGIYVSQRNQGHMKDMIMTFTDIPKLVNISGSSLKKSISKCMKDVGYGTNLHSAFNNLLTFARENRIPSDLMPEYILVLSDMCFNGYTFGFFDTFKAIEEMYEQYGYKAPRLVWWNLNGNTSAKTDFDGKTETAMVSGFSPVVLKGVLSGNILDPQTVMLDCIMNPRYDL